MGELFKWASTPLFLHIFLALLSPFFSAAILTGSTTFSPLPYLLSIVIIPPFVFTLAFVILFFADGQGVDQLGRRTGDPYRNNRVMWDVWGYLIASIVTWSLAGGFGIAHLVRFGDDAGDFEGFDAPARSYSAVNTMNLFLSFFVLHQGLSLVYGYVFKAYDKKNILYNTLRGHTNISVV